MDASPAAVPPSAPGPRWSAEVWQSHHHQFGRLASRILHDPGQSSSPRRVDTPQLRRAHHPPAASASARVIFWMTTGSPAGLGPSGRWRSSPPHVIALHHLAEDGVLAVGSSRGRGDEELAARWCWGPRCMASRPSCRTSTARTRRRSGSRVTAAGSRRVAATDHEAGITRWKMTPSYRACPSCARPCAVGPLLLARGRPRDWPPSGRVLREQADDDGARLVSIVAGGPVRPGPSSSTHRRLRELNFSGWAWPRGRGIGRGLLLLRRTPCRRRQ